MWKTNIAPSKSCYRTTYVPMESGVPQVSILHPSIFIYILWSWYTSRPLGTSPYSICKWYHCIHVRVVVLGYKIHKHAWSRQSCNMGKKCQISLQTIFFTKKLVSRHVNQVGKRHLEQSTHHVYMQFILITKHKHMYINSRIIQIKQKRYFPFFSFFVNRYDIICILIPESYKQMFVFPFFPC